MLDYETFLTELYTMVDDFSKDKWTAKTQPGPRASLNSSEVVTIALAGQWHWYVSERGFYRYLRRPWLAAFPTLPLADP